MVREPLAWAERQLRQWGVADAAVEWLAYASIITLVILISLLANFVARRIIIRWVHVFVDKTETHWDDALLKHRVFHRLAHLAPATIIYLAAPIMFPHTSRLSDGVRHVAMAYMILMGALIFSGALSAAQDIYRSYDVSRKTPIKTYVQVAKLLIYLVTAILVISTLMNRSPWVFLSGLGALTAIIMLVFKDTILGFVASVQLAANDMVRPGDWVEMPQYMADGNVIDVSLNTVKVQNWDKTISTIPTYALMQNTFKNWRGMQESGGRRIKRAMLIDMNSIKFCDEEMLNRFERFDLIADYIRDKRKELHEYNVERGDRAKDPVNTRRLTNVGTFRAYVIAYLHNHPKIHKNMTFLVRQLPPSERGLPLEIYVFSTDPVWANYESLQADLFDHLLSVVAHFDLRLFQLPSGRDLQDTLALDSRAAGI